MYLDESAIDSTFQLIKEIAGKESILVFDAIYASVLREENLFYGESEIFNVVKKANEKWTFGIEANEIDIFLKKWDFMLQEQYDSLSLEQKYFTDKNRQLVGKINSTHCLFLAIIK